MSRSACYHVQLSGELATRAGRSRLRIAWADDRALPEAAELRARIAQEVPDLAALIERSLLVAGDRIVGADEPIPQDARLSLVPPVSGG